MASLDGPFGFEGDLGGMNFYYNRLAGRIVGRRKRKNLSEEVKTEEKYEGFRASGKIHGDASRYCSKFAECVRDAIKNTYDNKMFNRLVKTGKEIIQLAGEEAEHPFHTPAVLQFNSFQFNKTADVPSLVNSGYSCEVEDGVVKFSFNAPDVKPVRYSTHYQFACCVAALDFAEGVYDGGYKKSQMFAHYTEYEAFDIEVDIPPGYPVYFAILIFRQFSCSGERYSISFNKTGLAADVVKVWLGKEELKTKS